MAPMCDLLPVLRIARIRHGSAAATDEVDNVGRSFAVESATEPCPMFGPARHQLSCGLQR